MDKEYVKGVIERIENSRKPLPDELRSKLETIKSNLNDISQDRFELLTNGAVRVSPVEGTTTEKNPLEDLRDIYSQLEVLGYSGEEDAELQHAIIQLRGIFDIPDRYYP